MIYLEETAAASLADDLRDTFANGTWLLENVAPAILKRQSSLWGKTLRGAHAEHQFAPDNGWEFFHAPGWKASEPTKSLFEEARRFGRETVGLRLTRLLTPRRYELLRTSVEYAMMRPATASHLPNVQRA